MVSKEKEKENLWNAIASRKTHTKLVDFPDYDENGKPFCQILIKTISLDDTVKIQKDATNECDKSFIEEKEKIDRNSKLYLDRYENIAAKHFLFHCCYEPTEPSKRVFPTPGQVGKLSQDEVSLLLLEHRRLQDSRSPFISNMTASEFENYVDDLAKSAEEGGYFLERILPDAKNQLLLSMATQLSALKQSQMDK